MAVTKGPPPWSYRKGSSFLHRLNGGAKLAGLFVFSLGAFLCGLYGLPFLALLIIVLACSAGARPRELLRGSGPLLIFVLAVFAFQALDVSFPNGSGGEAPVPEEGFSLPSLKVNPAGLREGLVFALRTALSFSAGALFFRVSTMREIREALSKIEFFFGLKKSLLSLSLSLMLAFLPRFFEIWEDLNLAWESRAGRGGLFRIFKLLPVLIERLMEKAADTAIALESRGVQ